MSNGNALCCRLERGILDAHTVKVPVTASVPVDCVFWSENDGWTGACAELSLTAHGNNFEEAKKNMEATLQAYITALVQERKMAA
jgi:hypothetical protein